MERQEFERKRNNWLNAFQTWSDKNMHDGRYAYGSCGYGAMCDYCKEPDKGRPCVRALKAYMKENGLTVDYGKRNFEEIWNGAGFISLRVPTELKHPTAEAPCCDGEGASAR